MPRGSIAAGLRLPALLPEVTLSESRSLFSGGRRGKKGANQAILCLFPRQKQPQRQISPLSIPVQIRAKAQTFPLPTMQSSALCNNTLRA